MASTRMYELATELLRLSQENKLTWEQTLRASQFQVDFPDVSLAISRDNVFQLTYTLDLINETGTVIDSLSVTPLTVSGKEVTNQQLPKPELDKLFDLAEGYVQDIVARRALQYLKTV